MNAKERNIMYQEFIQAHRNLTFGDLDSRGMSVADLRAIGGPHGIEIEAIVPRAAHSVFLIKHHGHLYEVRLSASPPSDHPFLHECMMRHHLTHVPSTKVQQLVPTLVAMDFQAGYIVSEHREVQPLGLPTFSMYETLFHALWDLERSQLFSTVLSPRTLAIQGTTIVMTDVAQLVPFDPLKDYNDQGLSLPQLHMVERFEKQFLIDAWAALETSDSVAAVIENIKIEKAAMLIVYLNKLRYVQTQAGSVTITAWMNGLIDEVKKYLVGPDELWQEYMTNRYRGYVKDMVDELDQPAILSTTLQKLDFLIQYAQNEEAKERYLKFKNDALQKPILEEPHE
jgi:hypothetical protein